MNIPHINHEFDLSPDEAEELWHNGIPLPEEADRELIEFSRIRQSKNKAGVWAVRFAQALTQDSEALEKETLRATDARIVGGIIKREYRLLREFGLNIVSRAITPISDEELITTAPWLKNLEPVNRTEFRRKVKPRIEAYYERVADRGGVFLGAGSLVLDKNYSRFGSDIFLRDLDFYLQEGTDQAQHLKDSI